MELLEFVVINSQQWASDAYESEPIPYMNVQFSSPLPKIALNPEGNAPADVCIANISPAERRKRLNFSLIQFGIAVVILIILVAFDVDKVWRLGLYLPFSAAASSFFQWRDKT